MKEGAFMKLSIKRGTNVLRIAVFIASLLCAAASVSAAGAAKPHVAVYVIGDKPENEKKILGNEITNSLLKSGRYAAAARTNDFLAALAQEQKKQRVSDALLREIAQQHDVEHVCLADITEIFNTSYISLRIVNAATGEVSVVNSAYNDLRNLSDVANAVGGIVETMFTIKPTGAAGEKPFQTDAPAAGNDAAATAAGSGDASYYYNQGYANSQSMDHDGAIANYTEALKIDPNLVYALIARGAAYYAKGDYQSAVEDYSRTLELEPNDAGVFNNRGNAYRKMGNYDMARADYEAALRIDPNNTEAKEALELIELDKSGAAEKPNQPSRRPRVRYGITGGGFAVPQARVMDGDRDDYQGAGLFGGFAMSAQINNWLMVKTGLLGTWRELAGNNKAPDVDAYAVSVPITVKAVTPWRYFGFYYECGFQYELFTQNKGGNFYDDYQAVSEGGIYFQLGGTWYLGINAVAGQRTTQAGTALSVMF